jgi:hypothetical protein
MGDHGSRDPLIAPKLIVLLGPSGCGILSLFCQLVERLFNDLVNENRLCYQFIDGAATQNHDDVLNLMLTPQFKDTTKTLGIVGIEISPLNQVSPFEVLSSFRMAGYSIVSCIGIVQSSTFQSPQNVGRSISLRLSLSRLLARSNLVMNHG